MLSTKYNNMRNQLRILKLTLKDLIQIEAGDAIINTCKAEIGRTKAIIELDTFIKALALQNGTTPY
jgi:hypothetical protein